MTMKQLYALAALLLCSTIAGATPRVLPFTYPVETLPAGKLEVEQYADIIPLRVEREKPDGTIDGVTGMRYVLQTELEYGLTDKVEVAWYFTFRQGATANTPFLQFSGMKQRVRARFADPGEWPIDVGVYLEIAEFNDEFEFEEKVLLQKRFGAFAVLANLWVEQEWYFQTEETKYIFNPTIGVTYELSPKFHVGFEYWARGRFDSTSDDVMGTSSDAPTGTRHYAGPTFLAQKGNYFVSLGVYARLDGLGDSAVVGDQYGKVWIRSLIGIEL
jgi:hypothetical protein